MALESEKYKELLGNNFRAITFVYAWLNLGNCIDIESKMSSIKNHSFEIVKEAHKTWLDYNYTLPELEKINKNPRLINFIQFHIYKTYKVKPILAEDPHTQLLALMDYVRAQLRNESILNEIPSTAVGESLDEKLKSIFKLSNTLSENTEWVNFQSIDHMKWVTKYITQKHNYPQLDSFIGAPKSSDVSHKGMQSFIQYFFDTLPYQTNDYYAENFLIKIKRANSQRKYRNENSERIASNYMLRKDVKVKLKEISKKERLNLNETIELLIEQAHAKLKGTS